MWEMLLVNWHLGFTSFGGPAVHFQIFHKLFVGKLKWIDEQTYQELFALSQVLPGPASTKMLFCINSIRNGWLVGTISFFVWSLPGAIGMYALSVGVARISELLPAPVYALLSGLNAATVGIIALAAVQLSEKAVTDKLTRLLVFLAGAIGMLYTALWFFPVIMVCAGVVTILWDLRLPHRALRSLRKRPEPDVVHLEAAPSTEHTPRAPTSALESDSAAQLRRPASVLPTSRPVSPSSSATSIPAPPAPAPELLTIRTGCIILAAFLATLVTILTLRSTLHHAPRPLSLFANMYLAGTIIFGGGPVVIPLLREYVVAEGWVSARDFLLGLALIQAFPGPNFNFAVYLGGLAVQGVRVHSLAGAVLGFVGIFAPGMVIIAGAVGFWRVMRTRRAVVAALRGINAAGVGLVYTAVYRLWQIGFVDGEHAAGAPLGIGPWWVAVTATSFVGGRWFGLSAPFAIVGGGVLGLMWYGIVKA
ncbi:hypothetical protein EJ06DRAFT_538853 [Trichodelitschia bisporula]|uniref:Chromate ion transporter n=1 Tax=Trichodelitschia bisporula TaxID=703511 RepID=A0A6G1HQS7_9PEZI|nr:hypothetical protein EJ06DRAFT_538853 [Trichodelitschia bisporula]